MLRPSFLPAWVVPKPLRAGGFLRARYRIVRHLLDSYGWARSYRMGACVDRNGDPIPWFTYPAIDFLRQLDLSGRAVFEWGGGASTFFWSARAARVVTVESEDEWYRHLAARVDPNVELVQASRDPEAYADTIGGRGLFDLIVIDGTGDSRLACSRRALEHIRPGGLVVLDNSDQWLKSAAALRAGGLIQADFTGFAPLSSHAHTTSAFFTREYDLAPREGYQPHASVAQPFPPWPDA